MHILILLMIFYGECHRRFMIKVFILRILNYQFSFYKLILIFKLINIGSSFLGSIIGNLKMIISWNLTVHYQEEKTLKRIIVYNFSQNKGILY